jgi:nucleoid DNA-binding protein
MAKKKKSGARARTKSDILTNVATETGLTRKDVGSVLESITTLIKKDLKKGPGVFTLPGLIKLKVVHKPATKARKGLNPFTGEEMMFKAKPAKNVVRARPLKALKDAV